MTQEELKRLIDDLDLAEQDAWNAYVRLQQLRLQAMRAAGLKNEELER